MTDAHRVGEPFGELTVAAQSKILEAGMPRGTGRTAAMLEEALDQGGRTHSVLLIFHSHSFRLEAMKQFRELAKTKDDTGADIVSERRGHLMMFRATRYFFHSQPDGEAPIAVAPGCPRYIDHHAVAVQIERLCRPEV